MPRKYQVANFPPEFIEFFRQARRQQVTIPAGDDWLPAGQATHLRQKLYHLRQALQNEKHRMATIAAGVSISMIQHPTEKLARLVGGPAYDSLAKELRKSLGEPTGEPEAAAYESEPSPPDQLPADVQSAILGYLKE